MKIDMSPEAVTNRMRALDQLWELAIALKSSELVRDPDETPNSEKNKQQSNDES